MFNAKKMVKEVNKTDKRRKALVRNRSKEFIKSCIIPEIKAQAKGGMCQLEHPPLPDTVSSDYFVTYLAKRGFSVDESPCGYTISWW